MYVSSVKSKIIDAKRAVTDRLFLRDEPKILCSSLNFKASAPYCAQALDKECSGEAASADLGPQVGRRLAHANLG